VAQTVRAPLSKKMCVYTMEYYLAIKKNERSIEENRWNCRLSSKVK
jgi:hypothetical protein